jgi:hypothetical protein
MFDRQKQGTDYCSYVEPLFQLFPNPSPKLNTGVWYPHQTAVNTNVDRVRELRGNIEGKVVWAETTISNFLKDENNRVIVIYDRVYDISGFATAQMKEFGMLS